MEDMQETLLQARNIHKIYSRKTSMTRKRVAGDFWRALLPFGRKQDAEIEATEFWALKDIDLTLKRGEAVGIIGLNGSGKTTLLRILAGQIVPNVGKVQVWGATASMIDLTAGFQPTASGRRNIYLRSAALGRDVAQVTAEIENIIEFSELGDAIEAPVATYSSGMQMKLAFSIMMSTSPEVLFIDEVLAVGDFRFRQKCLARLREIRERSSFVMVSHSMADIERFCDQALVLKDGQIVFHGESKEATAFYIDNVENAGPGEVTTVRDDQLARAMGVQFDGADVLNEVSARWDGVDKDGIAVLDVTQEIRLICRVDFREKLRHVTLGVPVYNDDGAYVVGFASRETYVDGLPHQIGVNEYSLSVSAQYFPPGVYHANLVIRDGVEHLYRQRIGSFEVSPNSNGVYGFVNLPHTWEHDAL